VPQDIPKTLCSHVLYAGEPRRACTGGTTQTHMTSSFQQPQRQQTLSRTRQTPVQTRLPLAVLCELTH
jgi:hypothetical protein